MSSVDQPGNTLDGLADANSNAKLGLNLARSLEACAIEEGFALASVIDLDLALPAIAPHIERYDRWIADGRAGAMQYLERGRDRRANPRLAMTEAQSMLCVALPYPKRAGGAESTESGVRYARYLRGRNYHDEIAERLESTMKLARVRTGLGEALRWKSCVDTSAVLERSWAAQAGLGWIGKNTLLIHPQLGSYFFLGEVLINQVTGQGPRPLPDYCGKCTRCIDGCPTNAITEAHWLDSRQCISYWTLEKRGALDLAESQKRAIGPWVAGCDICQEVCPFNVKPVRRERDPDGQHLAISRGGKTSTPRLSQPSTTAVSADSLNLWADLLREDLAAYRARIADSSLSRVKPPQFSRNLAIALGNAVLDHPTGLAALRADVERRLTHEIEPSARIEWARCLAAFGERT